MIFRDIRKLNLKVGDEVQMHANFSEKKTTMRVMIVQDNYFMLSDKLVYYSNGIMYQGLPSGIFHGDTVLIKRLLCCKITRITRL